MAPISVQGIQVSVLLALAGQVERDTVLVSRDIFEEIDRGTSRPSIAITFSGSTTWDLYKTKPSSKATPAHSTIWLSPSMYAKFCDQQVIVRGATPIGLTSLVLSFPSTTYHLINNNAADFNSLLQQGHILRSGDDLDINGYRGRVTFCEPVRQGVLTAQTEIVIAKDHIESSTEFYNNSRTIDSDEESDADELEFSSLLIQKPLARSVHLSYSISSLNEAAATVPITFLITRIPKDRISPILDPEQDPEYIIFASTILLVKLGLFSGDYVTICNHSTNEHARQTRIYSLPQDYKDLDTDHVYLPPVMYHNLAASQASHIFSLSRMKKALKTPVAKVVNLARIASPSTSEKALQNAFLSTLKSYFENHKRIVQSGDLLLLGIDETLARAMTGDGGEDDNLLEYAQHSQRFDDTFGWYKIVSVELDNDEIWQKDAYIDAATTRMIQTGSEKCRVPPLEQWSGYFSLPASPHFSSDRSSPFWKLHDLVSSTFSKTARRSYALSTILLHGARGSGKKTLVANVANTLGMHFLEVNCYDIVGETDLKTEAYLRLRFEKAGQCAPCILLLRNIDALAKKKDDMESGQESAMRFVLADCIKAVAQDAGSLFPAAIVATTADKDKIPDGVLGCFRHDLEIGAPDEVERQSILESLLRNLPLAPDVSVKSLAVRSAALVAIDLVNVVRKARYLAQDRMELLASGLGAFGQSDVHVAGSWITAGDFDAAIADARRNYSDSIGAPKIPNVTWDDVGGLASVKDDIMDTIQLPLERPDLFASGMKKRSGILFYGPPGTGKTLLAKAVATSFSLNFFSVKGPELLNMYIGESEANVRRVFQRARDAKPCVVFFDELDSVAPKRGNQGDSGGVMDRIVSQLLSELDGMSEGKDGSGGVFVIGATNRPDLLDPALLRPGRFDKMLYLGVSDTDDAQVNILQALTRKFKLAPTLNLRDIARSCPFTYTGADFYALCSDAMLKAMTRQAAAVDQKVKTLDPPRSTQYFFDHIATKQDVEVVVSENDFRAALQELVPSVSQSELEHYKKVQAQFTPTTKDHVASDKGKGRAVDTNGHAVNGSANHDRFQSDTADDDAEMYS